MRNALILSASLAALTPLPAQASPITTLHTVYLDSSGNPVPGTLTASLDVYVRRGGTTPMLVDQLSLGAGNDFSVVIPQAIIDTHASWEDVIPQATSPFGDWVLRVPGLNGVSNYPFGVTDVNFLDPWCSVPSVSNPPQPLAYVNGIFVMALRGDCTFAQKVTSIEASYGAGALIVNNVPGVGAPGISLGGLNPAIPVIGLSYERGAQIVALDSLDGTGAIVYVDFSARWDPDPNPTAVPEPTALLLFSTGLVGVAVARRSLRSPN